MAARPLEKSSLAVCAGAGERISSCGVEITFKSPILDEEDGWTVADYRLPSRQLGAPLHYHHDLIESFYVLSGEIYFCLGAENFALGQGGFVLVPPGVSHSFANQTGSSARMLAHASSPDHKKFLTELFRLAAAEPVWPPQNPRPLVELGRRYDTVYLL